MDSCNSNFFQKNKKRPLPQWRSRRLEYTLPVFLWCITFPPPLSRRRQRRLRRTPMDCSLSLHRSRIWPLSETVDSIRGMGSPNPKISLRETPRSAAKESEVPDGAVVLHAENHTPASLHTMIVTAAEKRQSPPPWGAHGPRGP